MDDIPDFVKRALYRDAAEQARLDEEQRHQDWLDSQPTPPDLILDIQECVDRIEVLAAQLRTKQDHLLELDAERYALTKTIAANQGELHALAIRHKDLTRLRSIK